MKVLVTGGNGFIGSHVALELERRNHELVVMDRGTDARADVRDPEAWARVAPVDAVIHMAGVLGTAELFDTPMLAVNTNIGGTINALQYCREHDARLVEIIMPDCWDNVYQATKHCAQKLATAWHRAFDIPTVSVRAFNVYGKRQAWGPGHPQKIVPTFATHAALGKPIPIWGSGYQHVDLISAEDTAKVLVAALETPGKDEVIDAGTGHRQTVFEVATNVWSAAQPDEQPILQFHPMRLGETTGMRRDTVSNCEGWGYLADEDKPTWDPAHLADVVSWYVEQVA